LRPAGALWGLFARYRRRLARPYRAQVPVLCVGNFTVGGTGKTPLVRHICGMLAAAGRRPVALTRGYGGRLAGPHWVDPAADAPQDVGDEALLLVQTAPTVLARDRSVGARAIEARHAPGTVIVMDDGLQNCTLNKDLSIAVVDAVRGVGNGLVIPAGPLRAPWEFQLEITDAIVVNGSPDAGTEVSDWLRRRFPGPVLRCATLASAFFHELAHQRVVAWAGIAHPDRFFDLLRRCGAVVVESVAFRDHQRLRAADAERLMELARRHDAQLVSTEKDLARLRATQGPCAALARLARALPVTLEFDAADGERLTALLEVARAL
jgi:tetraacyldisaccharide 4'-kinase